MIDRRKKVFGGSHSYYWTGVFGLVITLGCFSLVETWEENRYQARFDKAASAYHALFLSHFNNYLSELNALNRFYVGSVHVDRKEFRNFTLPVLTEYPEISVFMWVPRVMHENRESMEKKNWQKGLGNRVIWEHTEDGRMIYAQKRSFHFPVNYAEPLDLYQSVIGLDLIANPLLHDVLNQACDNNIAMMVPPNIQEPEISKAPNITIIQPVYMADAELDSMQARRNNLMGFVLLKLDLAKSFEFSLRNLHEKSINIDILDPSLPDTEQLLYSYRPEMGEYDTGLQLNSLGLREKFYKTSIPVVLAQRNWTLGFSPTLVYLQEYRQWLSLIVLLLGLITTVSLSAYVRATQIRTSAVQALVDERTSQLQETETKYKAIVDNAVEGIITISKNGIIESYNRAAQTLFGYRKEEVVGKNINILMPDDLAAKHDDYLQSYLYAGMPHVIGIERELNGRDKDGHVFPIEIAVSEMSMHGDSHFIGIIRDITERKRIEKMKNEFVSTVSHELRTPLTSIRGALGLMKGGVTGKIPESMKAMFDIATNNTERLLLLINDILDVQKIESGKMVLRMKSIELLPLLQSVVNDNTGYAEEYNVRFEIDEKSEYPLIYADPDRLVQVMNNLLSNAVKFSPSGESVSISTERKNRKIRIFVHDNGPGISPDFQPKLFDKFTQSDASDSRQTGGTGLGLFISKLIIEKHGGNIGFTSKQGVGTTFYIDLNNALDATDRLDTEKYA